MSYLYQSRLFDDSGALQVVMADTIPLSQPRYEEWAADSEGRSFVAYAPAVLPTTARRISISGLGGISLAVNTTGAVYVTDGSAKSSSDETFEGVRIRQDGVLYMSAVSTAVVPVVVKRAKGLNTDSNGSVVVGGLSFLRNFSDAGAGVANLTEGIGTGAATFTRATAGAAKLSTGLWKLDVASGSPRYTYAGLDTTVTTVGGYLPEGLRVNSALQSRDLTNAAWTKTTMTTAKTSTGIDGVSNSCTRCTASAGNATALQGITLASAVKATGFWIKRVTGSGEVDITIDNGLTWINVTGLINSSTFTLVQTTQTIANPTIGIRIVTNADAVDVDVAHLEDGAAFVSSPIPTVGATVTRNADVLTYPAGSFNTSTNPGTFFMQWQMFDVTDTGRKDVLLWDGGAGNNRMEARGDSDASTQAAVVYGTGAGTVTVTGGTVAANTTQKMAFAYGSGGGAVSLNGAAIVSNATASDFGAPTVLAIGGSNSGSASTYGPISRTYAYNYRTKDGNLTIMTAA